MDYLAKGKRGIVYLTTFKGKKAVIKKQLAAMDTLQNEANYLQLLNTHGIGPKFYAFDAGVVMEYIDGERIDDFAQHAAKKDLLTVLRAVLAQCRTLDKLGINKFELQHPHKHIIVRDKMPIMIDFERCRRTEKPKNVTQFVQFLTSTRFGLLLQDRGVHIDARIRDYAETYKKSLSEHDVETIKRCIS